MCDRNSDTLVYVLPTPTRINRRRFAACLAGFLLVSFAGAIYAGVLLANHLTANFH